MRKNRRTEKRLRLIPLILGGYGVFLGLGLAAIGLSEITGGIGIVRFALGLVMACFGLYGIWDGVRDLVRPDKEPEKPPASQFILTDTAGDRSSNVTAELLREQMDILVESEECRSFYLQILPPLSAGEYGMLNQISCFYQDKYHDDVALVAFFEMPKDGYRIYRKSTEPDTAAEWLGRLLAGEPDFSQWESIETEAPQEEEAEYEEEDIPQEETIKREDVDTQPDAESDGTDEAGRGCGEEGMDAETLDMFWHQLLADQQGLTAHWHKLLVIFGESWHDEHKFFSSRDLELAVDGIHSGKYQKAVLEWGYGAFNIFPGPLSDLMVIWCKNSGSGKESPRFLAREGTTTQVKFWLVNYIERGFLEETEGWSDITEQVEKEVKKGEKKHGKVF